MTENVIFLRDISSNFENNLCWKGALISNYIRNSLKRVNLHSLELRRLYTDLIYCYKMLFGLIDMQVTDFFEWTPNHNTRGHNFKLYKKCCTMRVRSTFLVSASSMSGIIYLPASVDFKSLSSFKQTHCQACRLI